jgi:hypothetical protein
VIPYYDILMELIERKFEYESLHDKFKRLNHKNPFKRNTIAQGFINRRHIDGEKYYESWVRIINNMLIFYRKLNTRTNTGNVFISFKYPSVVQTILENKHLVYNRKDTFNGQLLQVKVIYINSRTGQYHQHLLRLI